MTPEQWLDEMKRMRMTDPSKDAMARGMNRAASLSSRTVITDKGFVGTPHPGVSTERYTEYVLSSIRADQG